MFLISSIFYTVDYMTYRDCFPWKDYKLYWFKIQGASPLIKINSVSGSMAEWLTHQTSNLKIAGWVGLNPIRGKSMFPLARNFTLIA
jgi:hypothetical protein